ncbi:MAG: helicase-related protein, partial [Acidobacteriota bacterium]
MPGLAAATFRALSQPSDSVPPTESPDLLEKLSFRFVRELPRLPSAADLGIATAGVAPWPHQLKVIRRAVERYPQSFLFCDEVGLGKTIEAALALRSLWLSGRVRRALILVPKAVLRQWHEELHEKAFLPVARYEGGDFVDVGGEPLAPDRRVDSPWDRHDLILASTQTARTPSRRREILGAPRWDLVIVDEAHHARRRQIPGPFRPNRLLELLAGDGEGPGLRHRTKALYLLSATPMQIHPLEVWDLLRLLGLGGRWGTEERAFLDYFEQLKRPFSDRDWSLLLDLARESAVAPPADVEAILRDGVAAVRPRDRPTVDAWLRRATPIHGVVWRHTRPLLRRYRDAGLLKAGVPERRPRNVWVELTPVQRRLYRRIEAYLTEFYQRYEARRRGLGFVMTVYRRRLTSSFEAVRRSLERRRRYLLGEGERDPGDGVWQGVDGAQQELDLDAPAEGELPTPSVFSRDELGHLDDILRELSSVRDEPKLDRLRADLRRFLRRRDRALVFTQYLDTLDSLREALRADFRMACYSGRGGEVFRDGEWRAAPKEALKTAFAAGDIQVLLCTEAASEGLNLQTCGVLINYDMPWNPMRVEQRIGRIDRIGQVHRRVWIRNYFYAGTVEATVYERLHDRIDAFRAILGDLQPILHLGETIERLALTPEGRRRRRLEEAVQDLQSRLDDRPVDPLPVDGGGADTRAADETSPAQEPEARSTVSPRELEALFIESRVFTGRFERTSEPAVFRLTDRGASEDEALTVTFDPQIFAERPYSLHLISWGTSLFESLLSEVEDPEVDGDPAGLGLYASRNPAPVSVFAAPRAGDGDVAAITDLGALRRLLHSAPGRWRPDQEAAAASLFSTRRRHVLRGLEDVEAARRLTARKALRAEASDLLLRAAAAELLAAENPGLFDAPVAYGWGPGAVPAQAARGGPYPALLKIAGEAPDLPADHPEAAGLRGRSPEHLARVALEVERRGWQVAERWADLTAADEAARRAVTDRSAGLLDRLYFP